MFKTDLGSQRKTHKTLNTCPIAMKLDSFECNGFSVFLPPPPPQKKDF